MALGEWTLAEVAWLGVGVLAEASWGGAGGRPAGPSWGRRGPAPLALQKVRGCGSVGGAHGG